MAKAKKKRAPRKPKTEERELTVADALSEACGEIAALGEEMRSWYDSMPEGPQSGEKGTAVEEAADKLEAIDEPTIPVEVGALKFKYVEYKGRGNSRSKRRDDAVSLMEATCGFLEEVEEDEKNAANLREQAKALREEVEEKKQEAEDVEFPGMYG